MLFCWWRRRRRALYKYTGGPELVHNMWLYTPPKTRTEIGLITSVLLASSSSGVRARKIPDDKMLNMFSSWGNKFVYDVSDLRKLLSSSRRVWDWLCCTICIYSARSPFENLWLSSTRHLAEFSKKEKKSFYVWHLIVNLCFTEKIHVSYVFFFSQMITIRGS